MWGATRTERSRAPGTPEQLRSLNGFQGEARMRPFTCGREHGDLVDAVHEACMRAVITISEEDQP